MRALIVYDSTYGNTKRLARAIAETLTGAYTVEVVPAASTPVLTPGDLDLLLIGGPTQRHGLSPVMRRFLDQLERNSLRGVPVAAFDTRFEQPRWLTGSAGAGIVDRLRCAGCRLMVPPASFFVERSEGPLAPGEMETARVWAKGIASQAAAAV